ncbi:hypothetical protein LTS18_000640 [Coniosporium uncinatum]|uniref:Uncharacterized protein n=1 Tax=Coniosporium uncinatum TaxID=93489 RepID=A0ACC3D8J7_9PEZI|nr:hypothetical protein LTS18_000640 [Coniosporium uncinatum]
MSNVTTTTLVFTTSTTTTTTETSSTTLAGPVSTVEACANPYPTFVMQVYSGYGTGQYAQKPSNMGYLAALTTDRGSATQFYIASNGWLTPYPDHNAYNYIVIPVDNGGGTIFIQASDSRDPSALGGRVPCRARVYRRREGRCRVRWWRVGGSFSGAAIPVGLMRLEVLCWGRACMRGVRLRRMMLCPCAWLTLEKERQRSRVGELG